MNIKQQQNNDLVVYTCYSRSKQYFKLYLWSLGVNLFASQNLQPNIQIRHLF